jgi:hypothetical protein
MLQSPARQHEAVQVERRSGCSVETVPAAPSRINKATGTLMQQPRSAGVLRFPGTKPCPGTLVEGGAERIRPLVPEPSGNFPHRSRAMGVAAPDTATAMAAQARHRAHRRAASPSRVRAAARTQVEPLRELNPAQN